MKRILLIPLLLLSFIGFSQDWAPLKTTDSLKHFLSKDSISGFRIRGANSYRPIQSISVKSSTTNLNGVAKSFDKSFSVRKMSNTHLEEDLIKARLLGDSVQFYTDSICFFSIDSAGFKLVFPKKYVKGDTFTFAYSGTRLIFGVCDSLFQDTLSNNLIDSMAKITLRVTDLNLVDDTLHPFNTFFEISKVHGLITTPDFAGIHDNLQLFEIFFGLPEKLKCIIDLDIGDEVHQVEVLNNYNNIFFRENWFTMTLTGDSSHGNFHTYTFSENSKEYRPFPSSVSQRTYQTTLDTSLNCHFSKSAIIADSLLQFSMGGNSHPIYIYGLSNLSTHPVIKTKLYSDDIIDYLPSFTTWPPPIDSLLSGNSGRLTYSESFDFMGLGHSGYGNGFGGVGMSSYSKQIVYVKKGNQSWGTPVNLFVGLGEQINNKNELSLFPNPVNNILKIDAVTNYSTIEILNTNGQLVTTFPKQETYDVSGLNSGIYFLRIIADEGVRTKKFIKK